MYARGEEGISIICINGRQYRKTRIKQPNDQQNNREGRFEEEEEEYSHVLRFKLATALLKYVIGKKGQKKMEIERETGTKLFISDNSDCRNVSCGDSGRCIGSTPISQMIVIRGPSEDSVQSAKTRIQLLMDSVVSRIAYTHFISVPLTHAKLQEKIRDFYAELESLDHSVKRGLDSSMFVAPEHLHITILMLRMLTEEDQDKAIHIMNHISSQCYDMVGTVSTLVQLKGLEIMNDDPQSTDVLYIKVKEVIATQNAFDTNYLSPLQKLYAFLLKSFEDSKILDISSSGNDRQPLMKTHVTIVNSKYHKEDSGDNRAITTKDTRRTEKSLRKSFDSSFILKRFAEINFGEYRLESLQLSHRTEFDESTGYWKSLFTLNLP